MIDTAQAFGATPLRARWIAFAGHVRPALLLGCALVFMESVKELDLSLMLQPFGYSSPALKIYAFSRNQNMDRAAVWGSMLMRGGRLVANGPPAELAAGVAGEWARDYLRLGKPAEGLNAASR